MTDLPSRTQDDPADVAAPDAVDRVYFVIRTEEGTELGELAEGIPITFGRGDDARFQVKSSSVSRIHARLRRDGSGITIEDLGSRNGTRVNDEVLRSATRTVTSGDVVHLGPAEIVLFASTRTAKRGAPSDAPHARAREPAMVELWEMVRRIAHAPTTALILGETGAGKEIVAEEIHRSSPRALGPMVRLNCASLPETLLESELFGHEKGAFTGADRKKTGYFEAAHGGTLLLDEIGELTLPTQVKLLRVLETRRLARVGGTQEFPIDVRVLAATHRDLLADVASGRFRQDLYFRISTFTLKVPPLRERRSEILPLALHFAEQLARQFGRSTRVTPQLAPETRDALLRYDYPGNVRELRNAIEHAVVLADGGTLRLEHLPETLRLANRTAPTARPVNAPEDQGASRQRMPDRIAALERRSIEDALASEHGNQTRAAKRLGISRHALLYKLAKYGLR